MLVNKNRLSIGRALWRLDGAGEAPIIGDDHGSLGIAKISASDQHKTMVTERTFP